MGDLSLMEDETMLRMLMAAISAALQHRRHQPDTTHIKLSLTPASKRESGGRGRGWGLGGSEGNQEWIGHPLSGIGG